MRFIRQLEKIKYKLDDHKAFTLAETLVSMLIMLMVSSILAAGIPVARQAYEKIVVASNAEVLLSTTISALRNELGTADSVEVLTDGTTVTFYNETLSTTSRIYLAGSGDKDPNGDTITAGTITYQRYYKTDLSSSEDGIVDGGGRKPGEKMRLVSSEASNKNLTVTYESASTSTVKTGEIITFKNLRVIPEKGGSPVAKRDKISIRIIGSN